MLDAAGMHCFICQLPFDFAAGEVAHIVKHVAYGYDFAHEGACLAAAYELIFPEPGYDCAAFGPDPLRVRIVGAERFGWVLVEYRDGSRRPERITRDAEWANEPGAAEFPNVEWLEMVAA
jgi:hypothetical protein